MIETFTNLVIVAPVITLALIHVYGASDTLAATRKLMARTRKTIKQSVKHSLAPLGATLRGIR